MENLHALAVSGGGNEEREAFWKCSCATASSGGVVGHVLASHASLTVVI